MKPSTTTHLTAHAAEGIFELKTYPGEGFCVVKGCRNKFGRYKQSLCHKHFQQRFRMRNVKASVYATLRDHAKQRGIEFKLSYDYFLALMDVAAHLYPAPSGKGDTITFDRADATKGYIHGNVVPRTLSYNVAKGNRERHLPAHIQSMLERKREKAWKMSGVMEGDPDTPF